MNEQTQLVLYPSADRQPMEFDGGVHDVVLRSKATHEPRGSVNDPLQIATVEYGRSASRALQ